MAAALTGWALDAGCDLAGVARAAPARTRGALERWLAAGMHGEMGYMERTADVRADPRHLLEGCRSLLVVAISYHSSLPASTEAQPADRVWVSRYAWGRDYHRLLKRQLIRVGRRLEEAFPGARWRTCVDTAPLLEREWAMRAGLGWIGRNSQLLNRRLGSELFLGALLTDLEATPDEPERDHCGRCTACLDACPTDAFARPRVLDARRCIAYLTVEHDGDVGRELARGVGANVAGCDVCQEVCPWNRKAPADLHRELAPAPGRYRPRLAELETLDEAGYRDWRRGSALGRIPYARFTRNLALARANLARVIHQ